MSRAAEAAVGATVRAGAGLYDRARHLPWLARATPDEIASPDPAVARAILARLARALRAERRRGRAGHWTYDMNRHIALMQAVAAERERLGRGSGRGARNAVRRPGTGPRGKGGAEPAQPRLRR